TTCARHPPQHKPKGVFFTRPPAETLNAGPAPLQPRRIRNWVTRFNHADTSKLSPIAVAGDRNPAYSLGGNPQPVKVVRFRYLAHRSRRFAGCEYNELARRRGR